MYRRILAPVDGSALSMVGLRHAIGLAKDQRARLRVLNVVDDVIMTPMMLDSAGVADYADVAESLRAEGRKVLGKAAAIAGKSGVRAQTVQIENRGNLVSEAILADARRSRADIIVMGTHGRRGLNRLLLGSDAERVLREATVPVLLARLEPRKRGKTKRGARR